MAVGQGITIVVVDIDTPAVITCTVETPFTLGGEEPSNAPKATVVYKKKCPTNSVAAHREREDHKTNQIIKKRSL